MTVKDRILQFCNAVGVRPGRFERECGLSNGYLSKLRNEPSRDKIGIIASTYPNLNIDWLLTGEGSMLKESSAVEGEKVRQASRRPIRYWTDVDATGGGVQLFDDTLTKEYIDISIPEFRDCTDAVNIYGDSMAPLYKSGQIIILKEWIENFIDFGNVYLVITRNGNRMVKYLYNRKNEMCINMNCDDKRDS